MAYDTKINVEHQVQNDDLNGASTYPSVAELEASAEAKGAVEGHLVHASGLHKIALASSHDGGVHTLGAYDGALSSTMANSGLIRSSREHVEFQIDADMTLMSGERLTQLQAMNGDWATELGLITAKISEIQTGFAWKHEALDGAGLIALGLQPGEGAVVKSVAAIFHKVDPGMGQDFTDNAVKEKLKLTDTNGDSVIDATDAAAWEEIFTAIAGEDWVCVLEEDSLSEVRKQWLASFLTPDVAHFGASADAGLAAQNGLYGDYSQTSAAAGALDFSYSLAKHDVLDGVSHGMDEAGTGLAREMGSLTRMKRSGASLSQRGNVFCKWVDEVLVADLQAVDGIKAKVDAVISAMAGDKHTLDLVMGTADAGQGFDGSVLTVAGVQADDVSDLRIYINGLLLADAANDYQAAQDAGGDLQILFAGGDVPAGQGPDADDKIIVEFRELLTDAAIASLMADIDAVIPDPADSSVDVIA